MIASFKDYRAQQLFNDEIPRRFPNDIVKVARRKLMYLDAAKNINDLKVPPANFLEALKNDRKGQYSIRINDKWRICFRFENGRALDVEIVDYH